MTKAPTELDAEKALRAALSQMGSHVGCAKGPVSGMNTKTWVVENTLSLAWRIGRAVMLARCTNNIDNVAEAIVAEAGGAGSASVLFKGKIVGVERLLRMGHAYGEVVIEGEDSGSKKAKMIIPFKNENILAKKVKNDGTEEVWKQVARINHRMPEQFFRQIRGVSADISFIDRCKRAGSYYSH